MDTGESLSLDQLRARIRAAAGERVPSAETLDALALGFSDPDTATKPIERGLGEAGVVYAWRSEDADAVKAALDFLESVPAIFGGEVGGAGKSVKELLTFWMRLRRSRVRVSEPRQVAVLLELKRHATGATAGTLWRALKDAAGREVLTLDDVEDALEHLTKAEASQGVKQLVIWDGQLWKCLV